MKKIKIALALSLISAFAVSCQKDCLQDSHSAVEEQIPIGFRHLTYWLDGTSNSVVIHGEGELSGLLHRLTNFAMEGHLIRISNDGISPLQNMTKDVVEFSTKNQGEFDEWMMKMLDGGYEVEFYYDDKTGIFYGTAYKK